MDRGVEGSAVGREHPRRRLLPLLLLACVCACRFHYESGGPATPPPPTAFVTDRAGLLTPGTRESLDHKLEFLERDTGHQVVVYIGRSIGGASLEEWAANTFQAWGVGRKGLDDGAVLFVLADDRKARIEVGYGLEDRVTDALASSIIGDTLIPKMRAGDPDGAIASAVDRLAAAVAGAPPGPASPGRSTAVRRTEAPGPGQVIFLVIVGFALLVLFATHPTLALWLLINVASGGRGGGDGSRRGGFSGGGGRSGGGGASGSW